MSKDSFRELLTYAAFLLEINPREENTNAVSKDEQRTDARDARLHFT